MGGGLKATTRNSEMSAIVRISRSVNQRALEWAELGSRAGYEYESGSGCGWKLESGYLSDMLLAGHFVRVNCVDLARTSIFRIYFYISIFLVFWISICII